MTPKRKEALQFYSDAGAYSRLEDQPDAPTLNMTARMAFAGEIEIVDEEPWYDVNVDAMALTDLGRRRLHGDDI